MSSTEINKLITQIFDALARLVKNNTGSTTYIRVRRIMKILEEENGGKLVKRKSVERILHNVLHDLSTAQLIVKCGRTGRGILYILTRDSVLWNLLNSCQPSCLAARYIAYKKYGGSLLAHLFKCVSLNDDFHNAEVPSS